MAAADPGGDAPPAKPVMTWMLLNVQPLFHLVDGRLTDGIGDGLVKELVREWPEMDHKFLVVSQARGSAYLAEGFPACFPAILVSPERERVAYFSLSHLANPLQVIVRGDVADRLPKNSRGEVLPAALFDRPDLRGLLEQGRAYSPMLDALLKARSPQSGVREVHLVDSGSNLLNMLRLGRADYTMDFDFVVAYQEKRYPELKRGVGLRSFAVAGTTQPLVGTACPRTEWGRAMIVKIDELMSKIAKRPDYRDAENRWMTPDGLRLYKTARDEFFRQRALPSNPAIFPPVPGNK